MGVRNRLIATLLVRNGRIVQSVNFKHTNVIGNLFTAVDFFATWEVDELVILDVSRIPGGHEQFLKEVVYEVTHRCFIPITVGGWIRSVEDAQKTIRWGADKVVINTEAYRQPELIAQMAMALGSQAVVVSIDVHKGEDGDRVCIDRGKEMVKCIPIEWAKWAVDCGAGEIYLTSIDRDGSMLGYDLELTKAVSEAVSVPVIASGGVGKWEHLVDGLTIGMADAVSVANKFHFMEHSTRAAKLFLMRAGMNVRPTTFMDMGWDRRVQYQVNYRAT